MVELPLFPLHTVLFPGAPLRLHIFEPRYQELIRTCLEKEQPFGVTLIEKGAEALGPLAEPHRVGCTAEIVDVQPLGDGRMNLTTLGRKRFRVLSLNSDERPYLTASVEDFPLLELDAPSLPAVNNLQGWVNRYLDLLAQTRNEKIGPIRLPADTAARLFMAAGLLQIPLPEKQDLLVQEIAANLLIAVSAVYRREVVLLQALLHESGRTPGTFSVN